MRTLFEAVEDDYKENQRKSLRDVQIRLKKHLLPAFGEVRAADFGTWHIKQYIARRRREEAPNSTRNRELRVSFGACGGCASGCTNAAHPQAAGGQCEGGFSGPGRLPATPRRTSCSSASVIRGWIPHGRSLRGVEENPMAAGGLEGKGRFSSRGALRRTGMRHTLTIYGDLRAWLEMAKAEHDAKFAACPWVFFDDGGKQIGAFRKAWASAGKRAGVPDLLFHDLPQISRDECGSRGGVATRHRADHGSQNRGDVPALSNRQQPRSFRRRAPNGRLAQTARHGQGYGQGGIIYGMGRLVGFEPTTFGTTIRRSTT